MIKTRLPKHLSCRQDKANHQYLFMISPYFADTTQSHCISTLEENMFNNARLVWALALLTSFSISCAVADEKTGKTKSGKSIDAEGEIPSTKPMKETVDNEKKARNGPF